MFGASSFFVAGLFGRRRRWDESAGDEHRAERIGHNGECGGFCDTYCECDVGGSGGDERDCDVSERIDVARDGVTEWVGDSVLREHRLRGRLA